MTDGEREILADIERDARETEESMPTTNGTLFEILTETDFDDDMILSDGGTNWTVNNLLDAIMNAESEGLTDNAEYALGYTEDGRVTISKVGESGLVNPPAYVQVLPE